MAFIPLDKTENISRGFHPIDDEEEAPASKPEPAKLKAEPSLLDTYQERVKGGLTAAGDFFSAIPGSVAAGLSVLSPPDDPIHGDSLEKIGDEAKKVMEGWMPSTHLKLSPEAKRGFEAAQTTLAEPAEIGGKGLKAAGFAAAPLLDKALAAIQYGGLSLTEESKLTPEEKQIYHAKRQEYIDRMRADNGIDFFNEAMDKPEMAPAYNAATETAGMLPGYGAFHAAGKALEGTLAKDRAGPENTKGPGIEPTVPGADVVAPETEVTARWGGLGIHNYGTPYMDPIGARGLDGRTEPSQQTRPQVNLADQQEPTLPDKDTPIIAEDIEAHKQEMQARAEADHAKEQPIPPPAIFEGYTKLNKRRKATPEAPDLTVESPEEAQARVQEHKDTTADISDAIDVLTTEDPSAMRGRVSVQNLSELKEKMGEYGKYTGEILDRIQGDKGLTKQINSIQDQIQNINSLIEDRLIQISESLYVRNGEINRGKSLESKYGKWTKEVQAEKDKLNQMSDELYTRLNDKYGDFTSAPLPAEITKSKNFQEGALNLEDIKEGVKDLGRRFRNAWEESKIVPERKLGQEEDNPARRIVDAFLEPKDPNSAVFRNNLRGGVEPRPFNKGFGGKQSGAIDPSIFKKESYKEEREKLSKLLEEYYSLRDAGQTDSKFNISTNKNKEQLGPLKKEIDSLGKKVLALKEKETKTKEDIDSQGGSAKVLPLNKGPGGKQGGAVDPWLRKDPTYNENRQRLREEDFAREHEEFAKLVQARVTKEIEDNLNKATPKTKVGKLIQGTTLEASIDHVAEKLKALQNAPTSQAIMRSLFPLAAGPKETAGLIKEFANQQATALYARARLIQILNKLSKDENRQLYDARSADEQAEKQGRQGTAIANLPPKLKKIHETVQNDYIDALQKAQEGGVMVGGYENYTPRRLIAMLSDGTVKDLAGLTRRDSIGGVYGPKSSMGELRQRKYGTVEETEAAARATFGDNISVVRDIRALPMVTADLRRVTATKALLEGIRKWGNDNFVDTIGTEPKRNWMTLNHPAFKHVWIHPDFFPAIESILNSKGAGSGIIDALMTLKSKSMGLLMFNPFVHGTVIYSKAIPYDRWAVASGMAYMKGGALRGSPLPGWMYDLYGIKERANPEQGWAYQQEAMTHGFRPPQQATGARMETSDLYADPQIGNSWTAKLVGKAASLFNKEVEAKQGIDKAGEFWHGSLLWNRISDLGMYIYDKSWRDLVKEGMQPDDAKKVASHIANRYMGTVPYESMSSGLRTTLNLSLFSRQFNVTNMGIYKDFLSGLPKEVQGQIKDMKGLAIGNKYLQSKQGVALVWDIVGMNLIASSIIQTIVAAARKNDDFWKDWGTNIPKDVWKESKEYATRLGDWFEHIGNDPTALAHPEEITPMSRNEPGKEDRIYLGNDENGTGMYMKNPFGKVGEDLLNMFKRPIHLALSKQSQFAKFFVGNEYKGGIFSKDVWGPDDKAMTFLEKVGVLAKLTADSFLPFGNVDSVSEMLKGNPNKIHTLKAVGALSPASFSKGRPGGPDQSVIKAENAREEFRFTQNKRAIDNMLERDDIDGAYERLLKVGKDEKEASSYIKQFYGLEKSDVERTLKMYKKGKDETIDDFEKVNNY